ncbi:cupin domain-containing protein [Corynebacterium poyangense]|uniref:Cupin domain-containing protein n=1 Tax=Corynebacterium poyangense TaxID=2684405 RepID=A0A7H0SKY3_9CORY|nr:cupin domain-containing protein [Corynebacterium poyangense]QNQ89208.1 cupin domain-containing protein [Corynebacterium poyangense]
MSNNSNATNQTDSEPLEAEAEKLIGPKIKEIRKNRRMSLRDLGKIAGVSAGHISQIERGLASPSVGLLYKLAEVLDIPIDAIFGRDNISGDSVTNNNLTNINSNNVSLVRKVNRKSLTMSGGVVWELLTQQPEQSYSFRQITFPPGTSSTENGEYMRHTGQEFGIVIEGQLEVSIEFEQYILAEGDSLAFDSQLPHKFTNLSKTDIARIIWVHIKR